MHSLYTNITPLYVSDFSIHGFWHPWGVLEPILHGYQGTTVLLFQGKLSKCSASCQALRSPPTSCKHMGSHWHSNYGIVTQSCPQGTRMLPQQSSFPSSVISSRLYSKKCYLDESIYVDLLCVMPVHSTSWTVNSLQATNVLFYSVLPMGSMMSVLL